MNLLRKFILLPPMFLIWFAGLVTCMIGWNAAEEWLAAQLEKHLKLL